MSSIMKVALVTFDFGEICVRLASALAEHCRVLLCIPENELAPYRAMVHPAIEVWAFPKPRLRQGFRQIGVMWNLLRRIEAFAPDVTHVQSGHLWFNAFLWRLQSDSLVVTVHDPVRHLGDRGAYNTPQWVLDMGFRAASQLVVHAPQLKDTLQERLKLPRERIHVIPLILLGGDDVDTGDRERPEILFFGRIWKYKGLDYLIRAEPLITAQLPGARIVIAGTGENLDGYRRMITHPDRFEILNEYISDQQRAELFRRASVVVLPYIEASQSAVIPLAYSHRKPVVATTVGGLPAMVEDGVTGFLVPPRDEQALADRIVTLLQNPELRRTCGLNGYRKLHAECSPEVVARQTLAVYSEAVRAA